MRNLLIIGMMLAVASMAGWFKIQRDGQRTTIEIDRSEIRSDAKQAIERGREFLERRERAYAEQSSDPQQDMTGQSQPWPQQQVAPQQQQQWGTTYDPGQPSTGSAYQQVQYYNYNETYQPYPPSGNQASPPAPTGPYLPQQDYRR